jgi:hypothetical protein
MDNLKIIQIDGDLYDRLRAYCNRAGLRFKDFVEDALELAPDREEEYKQVTEASDMMKSMDLARKRSYRRGFWDGFCISFFASQGRMDLSFALMPEELQAKNERFKIPLGGQTKLFD